MDFSQINEVELQVEGAKPFGSFEQPVPEEGIALFRLREVLEFGSKDSDFKGVAKVVKPVSLVFELVHPRHAINRNDDGSFLRNHEVTVRLNKSNNDRAKYMKLFNKLNYDGAVATPAGTIPSFAAFLGKPFYGNVHANVSPANGKTYINLDKDGEYTIGAPRVAATDDMGAPTGEFNTIPVPEMNGAQKCFLWETGVDDATYKAMWESVAIVGEKKDGTPYKNWIQEAILSHENVALPGSRAERLFSFGEIDLSAAMAPTANEDDIPFGPSDPLAALGL
jgi:hypothetical protein